MFSYLKGCWAPELAVKRKAELSSLHHVFLYSFQRQYCMIKMKKRVIPAMSEQMPRPRNASVMPSLMPLRQYHTKR